MLTSHEFQEVKEGANIIHENSLLFLTYFTGLGILGEGYRRPGRDKLHQDCFKRQFKKMSKERACYSALFSLV